MIDQGLVMLVQADATVKSLCPCGGSLAELPDNVAYPSWTYIVVSQTQAYGLSGPQAQRFRRYQIDVYGSGAQVIGLAQAIDKVLSGFKGTLPDPDSTYVQGIFQSDLTDYYDDTSRSWRRMLEYEVYFQ